MSQEKARIEPGDPQRLAQEFTSHLGYRIGPYTLKKLIGVGGMGAVFLAIHERLQKKVALKLLRAEHKDKEGVAKRFFEEAKAAAATGHENIIQVFDVGEDEKLGPYLVMEYLENAVGLGELLRQEGPLPLERVAWIALQAARALNATHARGLVHCDLKPSNILLTEALGQKDVVKIIDFGVAKTIQTQGDDVAITKTVRGTPKYMSPEQVVGRPLDGRSDEYALGILVYQMLCGFPPFSGSAPAVVMRQQYRDPPPPLRASRPDLPREAEAVILRALEKRPEARYPTILEFGQALSEALRPKAPVSPWEAREAPISPQEIDRALEREEPRPNGSGSYVLEASRSPFSSLFPPPPSEGSRRSFLLGDEWGETGMVRPMEAGFLPERVAPRLTPYQTEELYAPRPLGEKTPPLPLVASPGGARAASAPGERDGPSTDTLDPVEEGAEGAADGGGKGAPLLANGSRESSRGAALERLYPTEAPGRFSEGSARRGPWVGLVAVLVMGGLLGLWAYLSGYLGGGFSNAGELSAQAATALEPPWDAFVEEPGTRPSTAPAAPGRP